MIQPQNKIPTQYDRKLAAVSYVPLLGLIVLYGHRREHFVCFHALQGVVLSLYFFVAYFVPMIGIYLALLFAAIAVSGFIHAVAGQDYRIFGLGHFLDWVLASRFDSRTKQA